MAINDSTRESVAHRVLQSFDQAHMTKCHRLRQAGLDEETLEELVKLYRKIGLEDVIDRTPEDRRPIPISLDELDGPRPGCV